ncbi:hypothetical protein BD414DRAFT_425210 [Trametes punicea]|nr:hypothetical protein BD414DRAFT_425210 [Trametes punicea]
MREYYGLLPSLDPEDEVDPKTLLDDSAIARTAESSPSRRGLLIEPYPNMSAYLFGRWFWNGTATKSDADRMDLLENCILHPDFDPDDLRGLNWKKIDHDLAAPTPGGGLWGSSDGWKRANVTIKVPFGKSGPPQNYDVSGLAYRPLEEVIASVCGSELSAGFHYTPYQLLWQPPLGPDGDAPPLEKVYGELYASRAFLDADAELQSSPPEPGCSLPRAVVACMPWSDSTHLAEYGNASLWPIYMQFGNQSKYERGRPNSHACHHVAYIPKLPSDIDDLIHQHTDLEAIDKIVTHCRRELMHGVWRVLLSDSFVQACRHGIVVKCYDGVTRRLYPRFFTYSADYPEKVLLATIRDMGNCPCPRCLVPKDAISAVGTTRDIRLRSHNIRVDDVDRRYKVNRARTFIYDQRRGIGSKAVEDLLKARSLVPTVNVFSERLSPFLQNFHTLFVPDFLHEWELGVWKNIMTHLIRILHAEAASVVREFNGRFRRVPVFGRDTIRHMSSNMSEMKQMAARDYEDALQCFIPVVDRLLPPPHNEITLDLLFNTASMHALHKLRMHIDSTVTAIDTFFIIFTASLRRFKQVTCTAYHTTELPREVQARVRRQLRTASQAGSSRSGDGGGSRSSGGSRSGTSGSSNAVAQDSLIAEKTASRRKEFNMNTYKVHSLGDYRESIVSVGTTDSYTSQIGEIAHRIAKTRFSRTSKKNFTQQLTNIERREARLEHISHQLRTDDSQPPPGSDGPKVSTAPGDSALREELTEGEYVMLTERYFIGRSQKVYEHIPSFVRAHLADPAAKGFVGQLKTHLFRRVIRERTQNLEADNVSFSDEQLRSLLFEHDRMYRHQIMRVNYTTYDVRRGQDIIHVGTDHCHVMVCANEEPSNLDGNSSLGEVSDDQEPILYWYAKVLGIYHVNVIDITEHALQPRRMEFLHVRWFGRDPEWQSGWAVKRLERIGFVPQTDDDAFGFLDPADVIRGCHLIPAFAEGHTSCLLGASLLARSISDGHQDWERYYVNRFVDRDMFMRYLGGAVGHGSQLVAAVQKLCSLLPEDDDDSEFGITFDWHM